ncbi:unnamed protein product [marine sediment metagenome]|uniref:Uncharacterized protein n=1 Tax=marine sediment metagenome TaxID=412755 RepID=X0VKK6_9ZZZZ
MVAEYPDARTEYVQYPQHIGTRKLAKKWGIPYKTIADQCKREDWVKERKRFQGKVRAKSEEEAAETLAEARSRWAREYRTLQAAGLKAFKKLEPRTAGEAARIIDLGIKGEVMQREDEKDTETPRTLLDLIRIAHEEEEDENKRTSSD